MIKNDKKKYDLEVESVHENKSPPIIDDGAKETGGPMGLEPTRYGDWEKNGRCVDF